MRLLKVNSFTILQFSLSPYLYVSYLGLGFSKRTAQFFNPMAAIQASVASMIARLVSKLSLSREEDPVNLWDLRAPEKGFVTPRFYLVGCLNTTKRGIATERREGSRRMEERECGGEKRGIAAEAERERDHRRRRREKDHRRRRRERRE